MIEASGKHWVTEVECSRNIMWHSEWQRVDRVAAKLKTEHPESFRHKLVRCRNGEKRDIWAITQGSSSQKIWSQTISNCP